MRTRYFGGVDGIVGKELCTGHQNRYICCSVCDFSPFLGLALIRVLPLNKKGVLSFEVWVLRSETRKGGFGGKGLLRFPCDEEFGRYAWSYQTEERALEKMSSLKGG
jgi:hypothetical protein